MPAEEIGVNLLGIGIPRRAPGARDYDDDGMLVPRFL